MPEAHQLERLFTDHLEQIRRVARFMCRRHGVTGDDVDDCLSGVILRLVEDDYAILRKFRGESSILTYLTVVIAMLVRDYRIQRWGRWRASAAALRHGPVAVQLETLLYRDGLPFNDAVQVMRSGAFGAVSEREIGVIHTLLKPRAALRAREVGEENLAGHAAVERADGGVLLAEHHSERTQVEAVLAEQLRHYNDQDRTILRLCLCEGLRIADVARGLNRPQRPLYRHIERLKGELRERLERAGVTRERVAALLDEGQA